MITVRKEAGDNRRNKMLNLDGLNLTLAVAEFAQEAAVMSFSGGSFSVADRRNLDETLWDADVEPKAFAVMVRNRRRALAT